MEPLTGGITKKENKQKKQKKQKNQKAQPEEENIKGKIMVHHMPGGTIQTIIVTPKERERFKIS